MVIIDVMNKLQAHQVIDYLDTHVPYRLGILLAHYRISVKKSPLVDDHAVANACFVASLVTARMCLNMLGIAKDKRKNCLVRFQPRDTDVCADDLGGTLIDPATLAQDEQHLFLNFLKMADQAAAHFTVPIIHDWKVTHEVIRRVHGHLKTHLYGPTNRRIQAM
jgi:hypothetical protein